MKIVLGILILLGLLFLLGKAAGDTKPYPGWSIPQQCAQHSNPDYWCYARNSVGCCAAWRPAPDQCRDSQLPGIERCAKWDRDLGCCVSWEIGRDDTPEDEAQRCRLTVKVEGSGWNCDPGLSYGEALGEAWSQCPPKQRCGEPYVSTYDEGPSNRCPADGRWWQSGDGTAHLYIVAQRCTPSFCEAGYGGLVCYP